MTKRWTPNCGAYAARASRMGTRRGREVMKERVVSKPGVVGEYLCGIGIALEPISDTQNLLNAFVTLSEGDLDRLQKDALAFLSRQPSFWPHSIEMV